MTQNAEFLRAAVKAWNDGGDEALLTFLDPEVVWLPPAESMEPGTYRGHDGVRDYLGRLGEMFGERHLEMMDVIDVDGETVVGIIRVIARSDRFGLDIDAEWAWLLKVREGKAIEVRMFTDRAQAVEAAGLSDT